MVNLDLLTSASNVFAAGNILRGADMHDICALEGRLAARSIMKRITLPDSGQQNWIPIKAEPPIRYVVPQKISPERIRQNRFGMFFPGYAFQTDTTLRHVVLEAVSGTNRIWKDNYRKLIANNRYPLPVDKFNWQGVMHTDGMVLRLRSAAD
jgi:hypothetical protein